MVLPGQPVNRPQIDPQMGCLRTELQGPDSLQPGQLKLFTGQGFHGDITVVEGLGIRVADLPGTGYIPRRQGVDIDHVLSAAAQVYQHIDVPAHQHAFALERPLGPYLQPLVVCIQPGLSRQGNKHIGV